MSVPEEDDSLGSKICQVIAPAVAHLDSAEEARFKFELSEVEIGTFREWEKEHNAVCPRRGTDNAMGMRFEFAFTKGSVGDVVIVRCGCGEEKNITDFSCW